MPHPLHELSDFDTPSITNVVATYPASPLCLGLYNPWARTGIPTNPSAACTRSWAAWPAMRSRVCMGCPTPTIRALSFMDVIDALDASPKPTFWCCSKNSRHLEIAGKVGLAGGNMVSAMKAIGCVGLISNGPSRDLDEISRCAFNIC